MLKYRILTALLLIPCVLLILFYASLPWFGLFTAVFALAAAAEWTNLMALTDIKKRASYVLLMALLFFGALYIPAIFIITISCIWWLFALLFVIMYPRLRTVWQSSVAKGVIGVLVLLPCWAALNILRMQKDGVYQLLFLFLIIWVADSAAYFVGKKWGKHKLAPSVSPGKSVEGFVAALCFTTLLAIVMFTWAEIPKELWPYGISLVLITTCFSVVGDLFESMLKRDVNLKDSGKLLPGHGGILDRIDSLTAAAPVFTTGAFLISFFIH